MTVAARQWRPRRLDVGASPKYQAKPIAPRVLPTSFKDDLPSRPVSFGDLSGLLAGRPCDPRAFRRIYPDQWRAFLHTHFLNHTHVAVFFDVDEKSARNWWEGTGGPQGWAVEFALRSIGNSGGHRE